MLLRGGTGFEYCVVPDSTLRQPESQFQVKFSPPLSIQNFHYAFFIRKEMPQSQVIGGVSG